jgi:hypothetical protein
MVAQGVAKGGSVFLRLWGSMLLKQMHETVARTMLAKKPMPIYAYINTEGIGVARLFGWMKFKP